MSSPGHAWASRWYRPVAVGLTVLILAWAAVIAVEVNTIVSQDPHVRPGIDLEIMRELGRRWLATGSMYLPYQLTGPYPIDATAWSLAETPALYPPAAGPVFALVWLGPIWLVGPLWWAVPLGIVGFAIARWRPAPWSWPLLALCVAAPMTTLQVMVGGTSLWIAAFVAAGLLWRWPAVFVLIKPTLAIFALIGINDRRWWLGALAIALLTLAGPWRDYLAVAANGSDAAGGLFYSIRHVPLLLIPVIAWAARRRVDRPAAPAPRPAVAT